MVPAILGLALVFLIGLLYAERRESQNGILFTKPVVSALFIVALFQKPQLETRYFALILSGLCFCWLGDIFLIFLARKKFFLLGLVAFLAGHVMYAIAFFAWGGLQLTTWLALPGIALVGVFTFLRLRPFLAEMAVPVLAYVSVISVMLLGASSLAGNPALPHSGRMMTMLGAFSFYISDIFVARQRFLRPQYANRFFGLVLYYIGQFLIALAVGDLAA